VIGAPTAAAEFEGLAPDLPQPNTVVLAPRPQPPAVVHQRAAYAQTYPAGWYAGPTGAMQWWDGHQWGPFAPPAAARPTKDVGIAYIFLLLLGGFAAHRFYVGRTGSAVALLVLFLAGWTLVAVAVGVVLLVAAYIWMIVDLFLLPSLVREANATTLTQSPFTSPRQF